jgi:hypothetical protein
MDASFLCAQNPSDVASSKGCTTFFLENEIACGRLSAIFMFPAENKNHVIPGIKLFKVEYGPDLS